MWMCAAALQGDAGEVLPELLGQLHVLKVVDQVDGGLGDPGGELLDLDAVELVDVHVRHLADRVDVEVLLSVAAQFAQPNEDVELQCADLAVGDDEEVAATGGGVEEGQRSQSGPQRFKAAHRLFGGFELGAQVVEEQRLQHLHDVGFAGVVRSQCRRASGSMTDWNMDPKMAGLMADQSNG